MRTVYKIESQMNVLNCHWSSLLDVLIYLERLLHLVQSLNQELYCLIQYAEIQKLFRKLQIMEKRKCALQTTQQELKETITIKQHELVGTKQSVKHYEHNVNITFIRHGESQFNVTEPNIYNTQNKAVSPNNALLDCGLTHKGIQQCSALNFEFDLLIVSPLRRCQETVEYSKIEYDRIITLHIFREYKTDICDFMAHEKRIGETENEIINRTNASKHVLQYIINDSPDIRSIGIVSHHDFIWYFTSEIIQNERFGTGLQNADFITLNTSAITQTLNVCNRQIMTVSKYGVS
eukprot:285257_1